MISYKNVKSAVKPKSIEFDDYHVYVNADIEQIATIIDDIEQIEYEFNQLIYTKDEYILLLSSQLTDTQLAICETYEEYNRS